MPSTSTLAADAVSSDSAANPIDIGKPTVKISMRNIYRFAMSFFHTISSRLRRKASIFRRKRFNTNC